MAKLYGKELTNEQYIAAWGAECVKRYPSSQVLPSLPICQAILESGWGMTELAVNHGNYHGMNWYNDAVTAKYPHWTMQRAPQERNGVVVYSAEEFCEFTNIQDELDCLYNWYNRNNNYYKSLHGSTNALNNFSLIKEAGYATDSSYAAKLTRIYNQYPSIKKFDDQVLNNNQQGGKKMTGQELANAAIAIYNNRNNWTYCQGALGQTAESDRVKNLYNYFRSKGGNSMTMDYNPWLIQNKGKQCTDCCNFITMLLGYTNSNYSTDDYARMTTCPDKNNAPAGTVLCMNGHVGLSIGNGEFIDFYAYNQTCRKGKIKEALFTKACYIKGVDYSSNKTLTGIEASVLGTHKIGDTLAAKDFLIKAKYSDGSVTTNPLGWGATPLQLTSTSNTILVAYQNKSIKITVPAQSTESYQLQVDLNDKVKANNLMQTLKNQGYTVNLINKKIK